MASVDDRIVAMKFDNAQFQKGVADTIKSMDDLKKSLDFSHAKQGAADLQNIGRGFNLDGMSQAIEGIGSKFTAMGAIAFTVISNITSRAVDAGIKIAKSLSLDQVISGFQEYETNMNSIQTVLANTKADGTTLNDVNAALDQLNTYSDQTIYNFSQMAKNIGTFTAAGIDLDTSVQGIKGIANLAAISGSNSEQASTAMYQLSQALASGSVKLMDWNSIVNAGMGGEVFQKSLFETGKALKTIKDVPMGQTFDEWKDAGNTFRGSLEEGWLTADVLTNTLAGFTGDLTEAQILSMGYTQEQVAGIMEMGKTGKAAATEVKTLTQLIGTVKESIGSGWSASFRIIFGTFDEAKAMFTDFNNIIGGVVAKNADARNALLQNWKDLGGREVLIEGIKNAFEALAGVIKPIKAAFRDIFPPATGQTLYDLTVRFRDFMEMLKPSPAQVVLITRAFRGIFAAFSIGISIVKAIAGMFVDFFHMFSDQDPNTGFLGFAAKVGDGIVRLRDALVDGGGITRFFTSLRNAIYNFFDGLTLDNVLERIGGAIQTLKDYFLGLFDGSSLEIPPGVTSALDRLQERFGWLVTFAGYLGDAWEWLMSKMDSIRDSFSKLGDKIGEAFSDIPQKIANALSGTNYDTALDTVNVGLLGGIVLLLKKFVDSNPFEGLNGLTDDIKKMFGGVTDTLDAMQTKLKSEALMNIAKALLVLVGAMVILSLIDSGALTKSLIAMGIGFGQLVGIMTALNQLSSGPGDAAKLALLAGGLALLGGALLLLALAMKVMSTMSWEDIAKGLVATTALIGGLALVMKPLTENSSGMIKVGAGLMLIAIALNILALAMKSMAEMNWEEMAQGFVGVGGGLVIIAGALKLMPNGGTLVLQGLGLIEIAIALNIMALALKSFAEMEWGEMLHGFAAMAGMLLILAGALAIMPNGVSMALTGAGLLAIGAGLVLMSQALQSLGGMSWGELAKGLVGVAATLLILAIACEAMQGSILGAVSIGIVSVALILLAKALKMFGSLSWGELLKGLLGLALTLGILAVAALLMQNAIPAMLGLGLALIVIGAGLALIGAGAFLLATAFSIILTAVVQNVDAVVTTLKLLIKFIPELIVAIGDGLLQLASKVVEALPGIISGLNEVLQALIQLIIDNIPLMIEAFVTFIVSALDAIETVFPKAVETGLALLMALLQGISDNIEEITTKVIEIATKFITTLAEHAEEFVTAGLDLLVSILTGISDNIEKVGDAAVEVLTEFIEAIGDGAIDLLVAGTQLITDIIKGIGAAATSVATAAADTIVAFLGGLDDNILMVIAAGWKFILDLISGITASIDANMPLLRTAGIKLAGAIINGMTFGIAGGVVDVVKSVKDMAGSAIGAAERFFGVGSPSRVFMEIGGWVATGLAIGIAKDTSAEESAVALSERVTIAFKDSMSQIPNALAGMSEFTPTITPVLDLTNVRAGANQIVGLMGKATVNADASYSQAAQLSFASREQTDNQTEDNKTQAPTEVTYVQNNYSPEALSTADIYRQTRSQIAMAKEDLALV